VTRKAVLAASINNGRHIRSDEELTFVWAKGRLQGVAEVLKHGKNVTCLDGTHMTDMLAHALEAVGTGGVGVDIFDPGKIKRDGGAQFLPACAHMRECILECAAGSVITLRGRADDS
jgi:hypothetical protein